MPECLNCGSHVTPDYARVFSTTEGGEVRVCPNCPDKIRGTDGHPRPARSTRRQSGSDDVDHSREDKDEVSKAL